MPTWTLRVASIRMWLPLSKNGGGTRASIGVNVGARELPPPANPLVGKAEGEISQLDIENSLRFNSGLSLLTLTAPQLLEVVEHAIAEAQPGVSTGQFPLRSGGLAFSYDLSGPAGGRVNSLVIIDFRREIRRIIIAQKWQGRRRQGSETFRIVTRDFLADGGDDYPFPNYPDTDRVDLPDVMTEEQSGGKADFYRSRQRAGCLRRIPCRELLGNAVFGPRCQSRKR